QTQSLLTHSRAHTHGRVQADGREGSLEDSDDSAPGTPSRPRPSGRRYRPSQAQSNLVRYRSSPKLQETVDGSGHGKEGFRSRNLKRLSKIKNLFTGGGKGKSSLSRSDVAIDALEDASRGDHRLSRTPSRLLTRTPPTRCQNLLL